MSIETFVYSENGKILRIDSRMESHRHKEISDPFITTNKEKY